MKPFWTHSNIVVLLRASLTQVALPCFTEKTNVGFYSFQRQHFWIEYQIHVFKGLIFQIMPWVLKIYFLSSYITLHNYEIKMIPWDIFQRNSC